MDGTLFICVISLMAISVAFVESKMMYEFQTVSPDRRVKYERIVEEIKRRDLPSEWDREMDQQVRNKYKELYYAAYVDRSGPNSQQIRKVVMEYIRQYHPDVHDEVETELEVLKRTAVKGPADWRKIVEGVSSTVPEAKPNVDKLPTFQDIGKNAMKELMQKEIKYFLNNSVYT